MLPFCGRNLTPLEIQICVNKGLHYLSAGGGEFIFKLRCHDFLFGTPLGTTLMMWILDASQLCFGLNQFYHGVPCIFYPVISNDCHLHPVKNWHETWTWPFSKKKKIYTKAPFLASITFSFGKRCIWNIWISTLNLSFHWWVHGGTVPLVFCGSPVPGGGGWNLWWKTLCPLQMEGGPQQKLGTSNLPGKLRRVYQQRKCNNKTPWQSNTESPA